jgi:PAS domain S-box-containing protein
VPHRVCASGSIDASHPVHKISPPHMSDLDKLQRIARRYQALASTEGSIVWVVDPQLNPTGRNEGWETYTGQLPSDYMGGGWISAIHPDDRARFTRKAAEALASRKALTIELAVRRADGLYRRNLVRAVPVFTDGVLTEWIGTATDIEEARQTEAELATALREQRDLRAEAERANRAKDEFLALLSHELRTPLNAIMGWTHMLRDGLPEEMARHAVDVISRNASLQKQLVEELLDVARIAGGKLDLETADVDVRDIARAAVDAALPAAHEKKIELALVCPPTPVIAVADSNRLQQVSANLLSNALKFTGAGGRVRVMVDDAEDAAALVVEDTGDGVDPEFLPFMFERFRQADASLNRSHGGLGLGLWVVKQIVDAHAGSVTAESNGIGTGTTIRVHIPRLPPA